jgi:hypothetical protein
MITLFAAAALAAQAPAAPAADPIAQHAQHQPAGEKGKDCCKDCCKDMAGKNEDHGAEHAEHGSR